MHDWPSALMQVIGPLGLRPLISRLDALPVAFALYRAAKLLTGLGCSKRFSAAGLNTLTLNR
jgi:hypothetical protein